MKIHWPFFHGYKSSEWPRFPVVIGAENFKKSERIYRFRAEVLTVWKTSCQQAFLDMRIHWPFFLGYKSCQWLRFPVVIAAESFKKRMKLERKIKIWINNWQHCLPAQFQRIANNNFTFVWHVTNFLRNATQAKSWQHFKCKYRVMYPTESQYTLFTNQVRYLRAITRFSATSRAHEPSSLQHYYVINIVS